MVTLIWGWPLLVELHTAVPGDQNFLDITELIWGLGWVRHALTSQSALFETQALFVPFTTDLRLHAFGLLPDLAAFPLTAVFGVVGAFNTIVLLSFFLNGAVIFFFLRDEVDHVPAALVAAVWFMLSVPVLSQIGNGRSSLGAMWIVAGALWALKRTLNQPRLRYGFILGLLLIAALLSDFQILLFAAMWMAVYGAYQLAARKVRLDRPTLLALALAAVMVTVPFVIIYLPGLTGLDEAGFPRPRLSDMSFFSFQLKHYFVPELWPVVFGGYELLVSAVLAIFLFRKHGGYLVWLLGSGLFLLLALGPFLQPTKIPLPFAALGLFEPLQQFRTPFRLTMLVALGLSGVAAYLLAHLLPRLRNNRLLIPLVVLLIAGRLALALAQNPLVIQTYPTYDFYQELADEPGDFTLLEVPFGVRSGLERIGSGGERFQYYQHIHGKKLINGSVSRLPSSIFAFYRQFPALLFLANEPTEVSQSDLTEDLTAVLAWSNTGYILLHRDYLEPETAVSIEQFLNSHPGLTYQSTEGDLIIYKTTSAIN